MSTSINNDNDDVATPRMPNGGPRIYLSVDAAVLECALDASASVMPDHPMEVIGAAWEAARRISPSACRREWVHRDAGAMSVMTRQARDAAMGAFDEHCDDPPCWTPSLSDTPHDRLERDLRIGWLTAAIEGLPDAHAEMLSLHLGLDDAPRTQVEIADAYGLSHTRVGQIVANAVVRLNRAWRRDMEQAEMVLSGIVVLPLDFEPLSVKQSAKDVQAALGVKPRSPKPPVQPVKPRRVPASFLTPPPKKERRSRVKLWGGGVSVYGHVVERVGEGVYRLKDGVEVDADGAARILCDLLGRESEEARGCHRILCKYDTYLADAMKDLVHGPSWPTPGKDRRVLLLMS
jgi:DNA-directed RNA polymerase specialized sigma24 family protein